MTRLLLLVAGICFAPGLWAATYTYTGSPFSQFTTFTTPCATGPCADYPAGAMVTGWFTTASPLPPGLPVTGIYVTSYSFSDGLNTYSSADPNSRVHSFMVGTDASGDIGAVHLAFSVWKTGSAPHAPGDRVSFMGTISGEVDAGLNNLRCDSVGLAYVADTCLGLIDNPSLSAASGPHGVWSSTVTPVVGLWWNPLESGSGYNIDVKHGVLVMTVHSYNKTTGEQEWYITSGPITNGSFTGTLNRYVGGQCISCAYNGLPTSAGNAGAVTINFTSPVSASMFLPGGRVTTIQPLEF
jgi:hypothetical protein